MPTRVYKASTPYEASFLVELLKQHGISAIVQGEHLFALRGKGAGINAWPEVHVLRTEDVEAAKEIVKEFEATRNAQVKLSTSTPPWKCPGCGEQSEGAFTACWSCGQEREAKSIPIGGPRHDADSPDKTKIEPSKAPLTSEEKKALWAEVAVVSSIAIIPDFLNAVFSVLWPAQYTPDITYQCFYLLIRSAQVSILILYLIWRSKEGWNVFGLGRIRIYEDGVGALISLALVFALNRGWRRLLMILFTRNEIQTYFFSENYLECDPSTISEYFLLIFSNLANGFAEELVMRAYLITRLERLLQSPWKAWLYSSILFSAYHAYQGVNGIIFALIFGLILGAMYCFLRRIWPIAIAHAGYNLFILLK